MAWFVHEVFPTETGGRLRVDLGDSAYFVDEFVPRIRPSPEILNAAKIVLRGFQDDLVALGSPVAYQDARRLMRERLWAITALIQLGQTHDVGAGLGHGYAKDVLLEVTDGAPLTICMGDRHRVRHGERAGVLTTAGYMPFSVDGCRAIIKEDTRTSGGEMWKGLCDQCRNKSRRNQGRRLRRRIDTVLSGASATVYKSMLRIDAGGQ